MVMRRGAWTAISVLFVGVLAGDATAAVTCAGERATVVGTAGPDRLVGGPGRDVIAGLGGADVIRSRGGNDLVCAGTGRRVDDGVVLGDEIRSGPGAYRVLGGCGVDVVWAGPGRDVVSGGSGGDALRGNKGSDRLRGGSGADHLADGPQADRVNGEAGRDVHEGGPGNDVDRGGDGRDWLWGHDGHDRMFGGDGRDALDFCMHVRLSCSDVPMVVDLAERTAIGRGNDSVVGFEVVRTGSGDDFVGGTERADQIETGDGEDEVRAGGGADAVFGGHGDDTLYGEDGRDRLDILFGDDSIDGGEGRDLVTARYFDTRTMYGSHSVMVDLANGGASFQGGNATLTSIEGAYGSNEDDFLGGDHRDNRLHAGPGEDTVDGRGGDDVCSGGEQTFGCEG
ncbi:MAG TPA: calcium-binding protein [Actinomycetota bacterium]|nr:calcium-binding protein [Actinomycetota bacterium]